MESQAARILALATVRLLARISTHESAAMPAIRSSPPFVLPVAAFTQPSAAGPQKPPESPIVLMNAMPPAAAGPAMVSDGIAQKTV
jgi:hypothetical protein